MRGTPYPTLGELLRRARATVAARPGALRLRAVGTSRAGRPLWLLSAGHGPGTSSRSPARTPTNRWAGSPRSPGREVRAGARAAPGVRLHLELPALPRPRRREPRRAMADRAAWRGLPGEGGPARAARRGRAAAEASPTLRGYYRRFYRPAFAAQPEFPPVMSDPRPVMPESEALVRLIDELRPVVQFSLHGVEVGGSFLQLTRAVPGRRPPTVGSRRTSASPGTPAVRRHGMAGREPGRARPAGQRPHRGTGPVRLHLTGDLAVRDAARNRVGGRRGALLERGRRERSSARRRAPARGRGGERDPARPGQTTGGGGGELGPRAPETPEEIAHFTAARELMDIGPGVVDTWNSAELATTVGNAVSLGVAARRIRCVRRP